MKEIIKSLLVGLLTFTLYYLIGCFVAADFNIMHWEKEGRMFCGVLGGLTSISIVCISFFYYNENK